MFEPFEKTILEMQDALNKGETTSVELVKYYLERIDKYNDTLHAIEHISPTAIEDAEKLDAERQSGKIRSSLHGIPIIIKENYDTVGMATTASCSALTDFYPKTEGYVIRKLRAAGAIILAKSTMSEFARHGWTSGTAFGQAHNPYDLTRTPGGSSGGSGIAISMNFGAAALGSDTVNSVRSPCSACSLVGIRPTLGVWSRTGILPCCNLQDSGGPMARTVEDAVLLLDLAKGYDDTDPMTTAQLGNVPDSYMDYLKADGLSGKRIGMVVNNFGSDPDILKVMDEAKAAIEKAGAEVIMLDDPMLESGSIFNKCDVQRYETRGALERYFASHIDCPVKTMKELVENKLIHESIFADFSACTYIETPLESAEYLEKIANVGLIRNHIAKVFAENCLDAMCFPHQSQLVSKVGSNSQPGRNGPVTSMTGLPSIVVPGGFSQPSEDAPIGVPIGVEFIAPMWQDHKLIEIAYGFEQNTKFRHAPII